MLIVFIWLGSVLPERYTEVINDCESYPGNRCVLLQEVHEKILLKKYHDLLHLSETRLNSLVMVQRADILRLLYLYDKGGIYSDLDNKINYECLENFAKGNKDTFYFSQEQKDPKNPSNNFIYSPNPEHPELKRVIQKIHECENCTGIHFASPYFLKRIKVPFKIMRECIDHGYQTSWLWTRHKYLKSPEEAKKEALKHAQEDEEAAKDPVKQKALMEKRAKEKMEKENKFLLGQEEMDKEVEKIKDIVKCQQKAKNIVDQKIELQKKFAQMWMSSQQPVYISDMDKQLAKVDLQAFKAQQKNIELEESYGECSVKIERKDNCPFIKKQNITVCEEKEQKQISCPQGSRSKFTLAFIASSMAFTGLLLCNIVRVCCWKNKREKAIKLNLEQVPNTESSRESNFENLRSEENSEVLSESRHLEGAEIK